MPAVKIPKVLTVSKVLDMVVEYYGADPYNRRSQNEEGACCYCGPDGKHCAVALFAKGKRKDLGEHEDQSVSDIWRYLPKRMTDIKVKTGAEAWRFWSAVQSLHDGAENWDVKGLSKDGKVKLKQIRKDFEP